MSGSLRDLIQAHYGPGVTTRTREKDVIVGTSVTQLYENNPQRIDVTIGHNGNTLIALSHEQAVTATTGTPLQPGGTGDLNFLENLEEVGIALHAISTVAGQSVHVTETLLV